MSKPKYFYDLIKDTAERMPDMETFLRRDKSGKIVGRTFSEMKGLVDQIIAGLIKNGIEIDDKITFLCDSSVNWILCDLAIVSSGAVSVPRGTDVTDDDITYIVTHSESKYAIVQTEESKKRLLGLKSEIPAIEKIWVIEDADGNIATGTDTIGELLETGKEALKADANLVSDRLAKTDPNALATLIYTSGTTGAPKGVMLNQTGWLTAFQNALAMKIYEPGDTSLSLLPPWHAFERAVEYAVLLLGGKFMVSDIKNLRNDLGEFKPTSFPSVPRIWEQLYNGIQNKLNNEDPTKKKVFNFFLEIGKLWSKQHSILFGYDPQELKNNFLVDLGRRLWAGIVMLAILPLNALGRQVIFKNIHDALGGNIRKSISGGSALPQVVDEFLSAIGIKVIEGYGMTETSAVISVRNMEKPTRGTVGKPIQGYEIRLKNDEGKVIPNEPGNKGTLWVKSNQILQGYYKRPELNDVVFDKDGFFDTGDLMKLSWRGDLMFAGRSKDTIALAGGENIEPVPIEDKLLASPFIDQVMVVGDDRKTLGALIVPNFERIEAELGDKVNGKTGWNENADVRNLYRGEISRIVNPDNGFKSFEIIPKNCFHVLAEPFNPDTEMTRTMKMKRPVIKENYSDQIAGIY